jgi:hypothetical protein
MGMSGQSHDTAAIYPPGKVPPVPIVQEAGWAAEPVWTQRLEEEYICLCRESNLNRPVVQPVARHYTDWATRLQITVSYKLKSMWQEMVRHYPSTRLAGLQNIRHCENRRTPRFEAKMLTCAPWSSNSVVPSGFGGLPVSRLAVLEVFKIRDGVFESGRFS